jgi:hypothetical protein
MTENRVADLLHIKTRFLRSAHIERDFRDPDAVRSYVPTDFARECIARLAAGANPRSGQRAWRITGDYGSGKSSLALVLAHCFEGDQSSIAREANAAMGLNRRLSRNLQFVPVLVTCAREPLATSILRGLRETLDRIGKFQNKTRIIHEVDGLLVGGEGSSDNAVLELISKVSSGVRTASPGRGMLLLIDELGKFLEFAAINPERQDVFLLQRLAEIASRSGDAPLFVICMLHQGFTAYADQLDQSSQREWEKVAGRFEEIVFNQPLLQVTQLVASSLGVRTSLIPHQEAMALSQAMETAQALGWYGPARSAGLGEIAPYLYPLHPTLLPVLVRFFRRFGQNERSLFSFLLSSEPFGLQAFSQRSMKEAKPYLLDDLYDYVRTNFGHRLAALSYRSHWNVIESVIESFSTDDDLQVTILKTIGLLNLLNDTDLLATEESVSCALEGHEPARLAQITGALEKLRARGLIYHRGRARGFCLWPHSSVDLEKAYGDARRAIATPRRVASHIAAYLETRPVVARRHYIETGNLRHYEVRYSSVGELPSLLQQPLTGADGRIIIPLCETSAERSEALLFAKASPQPLGNLAGLVQELQRWEWIGTNTSELNGDRYAREEVSRQKEDARRRLEARVQGAVGIRQFGLKTSLHWFHQARPLKITNGRDLLSKLSSIFDSAYCSGPRIHNELVNRRSLSSAAAAARMRLIERMFDDGSLPFLGMAPEKKPPEMSMYLSVLQETGLHQIQGDSWRIMEPRANADDRALLPVFRRIREILGGQPDARVNVAVLFEELRKAPYGVRDGLSPLLLTVFAIVHEQDTAFYKDGSFLREMNGEAMLVLTKSPERFEIQYCKITGVRAALFHKLVTVLQLERSDARKVELLDVVKPLCVFVAQLPPYVLSTKRLSPIALAARDVILNAREPAKLLFTDLPLACGFEPLSASNAVGKPVQSFVRTLKAALDELRAAYPELEERLRGRVREAFVLPGSFRQFREALAVRAESVLLARTEPKLRAFCLRLTDNNLPESEWLESIASYLALKPPSRWHDSEEDVFENELSQLALRFHRVESIIFTGGPAGSSLTGLRVAITHSDGVEHEQVVHFAVEEEGELLELQKRFEVLLANDRRLGLAAASRAIWKSLETGSERKNE